MLAELGRLEALEGSLRHECDEAAAELKREFAAKLVVDVDGVSVSIGDRRKAILKGLEAFADGHRDELLEGDAKSRELNHGILGWRKSPPSLTAAKRGESKGNQKLLEEAFGFIAERIEKLKFFAAGTLQFLRIKIEWDKEALKKAVLEREIDRSELRKAGFLLDEGEDAFFAEPRSQDLQAV